MIRLAAAPLTSPLVVNLAAGVETALWTPAIFTPLKRQKLGKIWRLTATFMSSAPTGEAASINFYYGSAISLSALLGSAAVNLGVPGLGSINALIALQSTGLVVVGGSASVSGIIPNSAVEVAASLGADSSVLVTIAPASTVAGEFVTVGSVVFEDLTGDDDGVPYLDPTGRVLVTAR